MKIYDAKAPSTETFLRLVARDSGELVLEIVDSTGRRISQGSLLSITKDGRLTVHSAVSEKAGLQLDAVGCIITNGYGV